MPAKRLPARERFLVTIAAIVKNESAYIAEWIEYHGLIGVEHFYIYDNGSGDDLADVLRPYLLDGRATLLCWPDFPGQMSAYNHAIKIFGRDSRWMALLDVDEFLHVQSDRTLPEALDRYGRNVDQILLPWLHFGSSGHERKPAGLVIESYVHRTPEAHRQPKTLVRPAAVRWAGVHHCETHRGRTVNVLGDQVPERWVLPQTVDGPLRVHHYFTKSREEFAAKIARGQADGGTGKTLADFHRFVTDMFDPSLAVWGDAVRQALDATARQPAQPANYAPRSAQSELVPSRSWNLAAIEAVARMEEQLRATAVELLSQEASLDHVLLTADDISPSLVVAAAGIVREKVRGEPLGSVTGHIRDSDLVELPIECEAVGRVYAVGRIASNAGGRVACRVDGADAAGKPWRDERGIVFEAGETFICMVLSTRTLQTQSAALRIESAAIVDISAELFSFS